ncbi:MAG: FHA domain-containing protein [Thermoguttaceae bacterium]
MEIQISIFVNNQLRTTRVVTTPCVLGRSRQANLTIGHSVVSRRHCELYTENDEVLLRDAGSLNGTYFRGEPISKSVRLQPGDSFRIGELTFVVNFRQDNQALSSGIVSVTPRTIPESSNTDSNTTAKQLSEISSGDSSSALSPPSSFEIIDLANLPESFSPNKSSTANANS